MSLYWSVCRPWASVARTNLACRLAAMKSLRCSRGYYRAVVNQAQPGFSHSDHSSPTAALGSSKGCPCPGLLGMFVQTHELHLLTLLLTIVTPAFFLFNFIITSCLWQLIVAVQLWLWLFSRSVVSDSETPMDFSMPGFLSVKIMRYNQFSKQNF